MLAQMETSERSAHHRRKDLTDDFCTQSTSVLSLNPSSPKSARVIPGPGPAAPTAPVAPTPPRDCRRAPSIVQSDEKEMEIFDAIQQAQWKDGRFGTMMITATNNSFRLFGMCLREHGNVQASLEHPLFLFILSVRSNTRLSVSSIRGKRTSDADALAHLGCSRSHSFTTMDLTEHSSFGENEHSAAELNFFPGKDHPVLR